MENEVEFFENRIASDKKAIEELEFKKQNDEMAKKLRVTYNSLIEQGFTEEQAFWMLAQFIQKAFENC